MRDMQIAKTKYKEGYWLVWKTNFNIPFKKDPIFEDKEELKNDIQVVLETEDKKYLGDAICHFGSYGVKDGLWETMIEGAEDVTGYLTFKEVLKQFNAVIRKFEKGILKND